MNFLNEYEMGLLQVSTRPTSYSEEQFILPAQKGAWIGDEKVLSTWSLNLPQRVKLNTWASTPILQVILSSQGR
jgi:hypothetical protein